MRSAKQRFEEKMVVTPGCWNWAAGKSRRGYGKFKVHGKDIKAHRFSYEMYNGPIPDGLFVMHKCDNPQCVNPDHLSVGTHADNMRDMSIKGRAPQGQGVFAKRRSYKGQNHPRAKLSYAQVDQIRLDGRVYRLIAADYGVCIATISHIKNGRFWADQGIH